MILVSLFQQSEKDCESCEGINGIGDADGMEKRGDGKQIDGMREQQTKYYKESKIKKRERMQRTNKIKD